MGCPPLATCTFFILLTFHSSLSLHSNWLRVSNADRDQTIRLIFAVKLTNTDWLEERFWAVSNPNSPEYGHFMTFEEIARKVRAKPGATSRITTALGRYNVPFIDVTSGENYILTRIKCASANQIFNTTFASYVNKDFPEIIVHKATSYTIPEEIADDVDFVLGIDNFPAVSPHYATKVRRKPLLPDNLGTTPSTILESYNISSYESSSPGNSQAVAAFLNQYFKPSDLARFQSHFKVPTNPIDKIVGENNDRRPGLESSLDVQYITAIGRKVATWFVYTPSLVNHGQEDFLTWIIGQTNTTNSPWVHSVSYGDIEKSIPDSFKDRVNNEFMKFGVSGRTVVFASGDGGAGCHGEKFVPNWPASSPYVTSVGGTTGHIAKEKAWTDGGGGFSNSFTMPDYQKEAVENYLKSGKAPPAQYFNKTGRAYPDLSAFATNFAIEYDNTFLSVDGTSCAAPTVAGILSLLNDVRMKQGKKTLGFVNPLLYQLAGKGFHDVTEGSNGNGLCPGFKATQGWDPTSGWGSPNFGILKGLV